MYDLVIIAYMICMYMYISCMILILYLKRPVHHPAGKSSSACTLGLRLLVTVMAAENEVLLQESPWPEKPHHSRRLLPVLAGLQSLLDRHRYCAWEAWAKSAGARQE